MRFILRYRYGFFQRKSQRILVTGCTTTDDLINYLEGKTFRKYDEFLLRYKSDRLSCRILKGWPLAHYEIKEEDEFELQMMEIRPDEQHNNHTNNRFLINVLGQTKQQLNRIVQVDNENEHQTEFSSSQTILQKAEFNMREYLDMELQKLLKYVQKGKLQSMLRVLSDLPSDVGEELTIELQKSKFKLLNELGEGGWGVIHYAVFCNRPEILEELIKRRVNVNKCTTDGWLPLQLAINRKNLQLAKILLRTESINVNELTAKGTALHIAARLSYQQGITELIEGGADSRITDEKGRTSVEVCSDQQSANMIKKQQEQRIKHEQVKDQFTSLSIIKGVLHRTKTVFLHIKPRYVVLDPYQGSLIIYDSLEKYPKHPKQTIPLEYIKLDSIALMTGDRRTWHMKKQYSYFEFYCPKKLIFATKHLEVAVRWVLGLQDAVKYQSYLTINRITEIVPEQDQVVIECNDTINKITSNKEIISEMVSPIRPKRQTKSIINTTSDQFRRSQASEFSSDGFSPVMPNILNILSLSSKPSDKTLDEELTLSSSGKKLSNDESNESTEICIQIREKKYKQKTQQIKADNKQANEEFNSIITDKTNFSSFQIIKVLGSGAFGKVFLARHIKTGKEFALKALKKKTLIMQKQIKYAVTEARVLKQANHPFIINLHYAFQTPNYLYLALDYCSGKDLSFHLAKDICFSEEATRVYMAELILAIEHLHSKDILYRDMKPQNILLDAEGHIKLADFGLSKDNVTDRTKSFCGSPAYLAPEVLNQTGGCRQTDLYGIGVVMYECLTGESAYYSDDMNTLYSNINQATLKFPKHMTEQAKSLISGLMERDTTKRLGANGFSQIKNHPFFQKIDWKLAEKRGLKPPIRDYSDNAEDSDDEIAMFTGQKCIFTDVDYSEIGIKANRLNDFSFVRVE